MTACKDKEIQRLGKKKKILVWFEGTYLGKKFLFVLTIGFEVNLNTNKYEYKSLSGLLGLADSITHYQTYHKPTKEKGRK